MRITNAQKYRQILAEVNEKVQKFVDSVFNERPTRIYAIQGADFQVYEHVIDEWDYYHRVQLYNDKPTTKDVIRARQYADNFQPVAEDIRVRYSGVNDYGRFTAAKPLKDIEKGERVSFDREPLETQAVKLRDIYIPKEGEIKCRYCGKAFPEQNAHVGNIISYANYGPAGRTYKYCSPTCHTYDQFAHEG